MACIVVPLDPELEGFTRIEDILNLKIPKFTVDQMKKQSEQRNQHDLYFQNLTQQHLLQNSQNGMAIPLKSFEGIDTINRNDQSILSSNNVEMISLGISSLVQNDTLLPHGPLESIKINEHSNPVVVDIDIDDTESSAFDYDKDNGDESDVSVVDV